MSAPSSDDQKEYDQVSRSPAFGEAINEGRVRTSDVSDEAPTMRSMSMMSVASGPTLKQSIGSVDTKGFGSSSKLGIPRPAVKGYVYGVKEEWSGVSIPCSWGVKGGDLEVVPWEFALERTHREIAADASAVAARISDALRALSIQAEFSSGKAKAKCMTMDYVCFRIRLFAGGENGQPVIVEIQRRNGAMSSFMQTCRAILDAAEGKSIEALKASANNRKSPPFMQKPIGSMQCLSSVVAKDRDFDAESSLALDGVLSMLRSAKRDSHMLGLENLCLLTDPVRTAPDVSIRVSKTIMLGDDDKYDIREEIRLLTDHDVFSSEFDEDQAGSAQTDRLCHLALCVFSNSLSICSKAGCLSEALDSQGWFAEYLIPSLIDELKRVETNANNSFQAASCIHCMVVSSPFIGRVLVDSGCKGALEKAHEFGKTRHELLAKEAERCLEAFKRLM